MDLEEQKIDSEWVFNDIKLKHGIPAYAVVNFQFIPVSDDASWTRFAKAAEKLGYKAIWVPVNDEFPELPAYLEISTPMEPLSFDSLWTHEALLTELGFSFGFDPDGWGFFGGDELDA